MKFLKISLAGIIASIGIVLFFYIYFGVWTVTVNENYSSISLPETDTAFGGIFSYPYIPDSLPHYKYKKLEDKYKRRSEYINTVNEGKFISNLFFGNIGLSAESRKDIYSECKKEDEQEKRNLDFLDSLFMVVANEKDMSKKVTLNRYYYSVKDTLEMKSTVKFFNNNYFSDKGFFYFSLKGYNLKHENIFFIKNETYNLAFVKWKNADSSKNNKLDKIGHYEHKQIKVRFNKSNNSVNIPISAKLNGILKITLMITISFLIGLSLYFFIGLPIQILLNISRGKVFIVDNFKYINQICLALITATACTILLPMVLHLFFMNRIPVEIYPDSFLTVLKNSFGLIIATVILMIIRKAFKKGYDLQNEQDLTV